MRCIKPKIVGEPEKPILQVNLTNWCLNGEMPTDTLAFVSPSIESLAKHRVVSRLTMTTRGIGILIHGETIITGVDGTVSTSLTVDVEHGRAIDIRFQLTPRLPSAGDQVVIELYAEDVKGNRWVVLKHHGGRGRRRCAYEQFLLHDAAGCASSIMEV